MKYHFDKKYLYWGITAFLTIISSLLFYYFLFHNTNVSKGLHQIIAIMMPIIDGFILAYLLNPIMNYIEEKWIHKICFKFKLSTTTPKQKRRVRFISIFVTMILFFFMIYIFLQMVIPQLFKSIQNIAIAFPTYMNNFSTWIAKIFSDNPDLENIVENYLDQYSTDIQKWLSGDVLPQINTLIKMLSTQVWGFFVFFWNMIIGIIISIYMLSSKELFSAQLKKILYAVFPEVKANMILDEVRFVHKTFGGFINGKLIDSLIIGILCFIVTNFLGTPYAVLVSVIVGVTNVIPFFGPYLGAIPSSILILLVNPRQCLYFIIFIIILQQFDGNVLGPKILGNSTGLSSFWVIFSITIFGGLFGILGMFIGVPVFAVIYAAIKRRCNRELRKKDLPDTTTSYLKLRHIHNSSLQLQDDPSISLKEEQPTGIHSHNKPQTHDPVKIIITKERINKDDKR